MTRIKNFLIALLLLPGNLAIAFIAVCAVSGFVFFGMLYWVYRSFRDRL